MQSQIDVTLTEAEKSTEWRILPWTDNRELTLITDFSRSSISDRKQRWKCRHWVTQAGKGHRKWHRQVKVTQAGKCHWTWHRRVKVIKSGTDEVTNRVKLTDGGKGENTRARAHTHTETAYTKPTKTKQTDGSGQKADRRTATVRTWRLSKNRIM